MSATRRHPSRAELTRAFEAVPSDVNAETHPDSVVYTFETAPRHLAYMAGLLADVLEIREHSPEVIQAEKRLIETELATSEQYDSDPLRALFNEHPFGLPLGGTPRSVRRLSNEDLIAFDRAGYDPKRITVAVVGRIPPAELDAVRQRLGSLAGGGHDDLQEPLVPQLSLPAFLRRSPKHRHRSVFLGFVLTVPLEPRERLILGVLGYRLTSVSTDLFERVRYSDGCTYNYSLGILEMRTTRVFGIHGLTRARDRDTFAEHALRELLGLRCEEKVSEWFDTLRDKYQFFVEHSLDSPESLANRIGAEEARDRLEAVLPISDELAILNELTPADLCEFANAVLTRECFFVHFDDRHRLFDTRRFRRRLERCFQR